jgi:hypothetical protein
MSVDHYAPETLKGLRDRLSGPQIWFKCDSEERISVVRGYSQEYSHQTQCITCMAPIINKMNSVLHYQMQYMM